MANEQNLTNFPKGQSGNPAGRPPETKTLVKDLVNTMYEAEKYEDIEDAYNKLNAMLIASMVEKSIERKANPKMYMFLHEKMQNHVENMKKKKKSPFNNTFTRIDDRLEELLFCIKRIDQLACKKNSINRFMSEYTEPRKVVEDLFKFIENNKEWVGQYVNIDAPK